MNVFSWNVFIYFVTPNRLCVYGLRWDSVQVNAANRNVEGALGGEEEEKGGSRVLTIEVKEGWQGFASAWMSSSWTTVSG